MPDFSQRSEELEIMDDLDASQGEVVFQTLRELSIINRRLGGNYVTTNGLAKLIKNADPIRPLRIADIGCGGGDMLMYIDRWAKKRNLKVDLVGVDFNPQITGFAQNNTAGFSNIRYLTQDIFSHEFAAHKFDLIVCSLFLHHFTANQLPPLLQQLSHQATLGVIINDLHRHPLAYYSIKLLTQLASRSAMVKYDAPLSVLRGFSAQDWHHTLREAKLSDYEVKWYWAFRWQVVIRGLG